MEDKSTAKENRHLSIQWLELKAASEMAVWGAGDLQRGHTATSDGRSVLHHHRVNHRVNTLPQPPT